MLELSDRLGINFFKSKLETSSFFRVLNKTLFFSKSELSKTRVYDSNYFVDFSDTAVFLVQRYTD